MPLYEYKTVPAPKKGEKAKGVRTPEGRIARAMQTVLNTEAQAGWEYVRADLLPMEERAGLTSKALTYHTVFVFRREISPDEVLDGSADFGVVPPLMDEAEPDLSDNDEGDEDAVEDDADTDSPSAPRA